MEGFYQGVRVEHVIRHRPRHPVGCRKDLNGDQSLQSLLLPVMILILALTSLKSEAAMHALAVWH